MATIKDVAAMAGVSFTTVSHVVNNSRPVSADVRAKVEGAIRELNYVPSAVARSLKARDGDHRPRRAEQHESVFRSLHAASRINARRTAIACSSATRTTTR
jgi:transcriptional regulator with XRE-family HTH domain